MHRSDLPSRMKFHASVRSVQWWAATQEGKMPLFLPLNASCVLLPALEFACAHGKPIQGAHPLKIPGCPTAHYLPSCPSQPSVGCRGQVAGAAPLGHETTARTVGNLSSISNYQCPQSFQLWQHWRIQAKEKKSWPLKVERCFRHWSGHLQQGPSESQQGLEGTKEEITPEGI